MSLAQVKTYATVTLVTVLIWLYAESESRRVVDLLTTVRVPASLSGDRLAWTEGVPGTFEVSVQLDGTTAAIDELRQVLSRQALDLSECDAFPVAPGTYTASLRAYLRGHPALRRRGVDVVRTEPASVTLHVAQAQRRSVPVALGDLAGVQVASPRFEPPSVTLVYPSQWEGRLGSVRVVAAVEGGEISAAPGSTVQIPEVPLRLEADAVPPVWFLEPASVGVTMVIRAQTRTITIPTVPVHIRAPPSVLHEWDIEIEGPAFLTEVEMTGPVEDVEAYARDPSDPLFRPLFAYVTVLPDDADQGKTEKTAQFSDLPTDRIQIKAGDRTVRLRYTRRERAPSEGGGEGGADGEPDAGV